MKSLGLLHEPVEMFFDLLDEMIDRLGFFPLLHIDDPFIVHMAIKFRQPVPDSLEEIVSCGFYLSVQDTFVQIPSSDWQNNKNLPLHRRRRRYPKHHVHTCKI